MARYAAPATRTVPTIAWAAISEDVPPLIYYIEFYRDMLPTAYRHIRVAVTPIVGKSKSRAKRKRAAPYGRE